MVSLPLIIEISPMKTSAILCLLLFLSACEDSGLEGAFKNDEVKLKVFLRSSPGDQQDVTFQMEHFEILFEHQGETGAVITGKRVKELALKDMSQKIPLSMDPVKLKAGALIKEVRLVLKSQNHYLLRLDGSQCNLNLYNKETSVTAPAVETRLESGMNYALILELAADSVMLDLGEEGDCVARPDFSVRSIRPLSHLDQEPVDELIEEEDEVIEEESI